MTEPTYRAASAAALCAVPLPPFAAVFHRPSGTTHLLVEPAPEILAALADGPLGLPALTARLRTEYDLSGDAEAALAARLRELVEAGLVEAA